MQMAQPYVGRKVLSGSAGKHIFLGFARALPACGLAAVAILVLAICQYLHGLPETETMVTWAPRELKLAGPEGAETCSYLSSERHGAAVALMLQPYRGRPDLREQHRHSVARAIRPALAQGSASGVTVLYPDEAMADFISPHPLSGRTGK
jgi:hypothetical protein